MKSGWFRESVRHSLASRGIKTAQKIPQSMTHRQNIDENKLRTDYLFNEWFEEIVKKDMEWYKEIKRKYELLLNEYPPPKDKRFPDSEERTLRTRAYNRAQSYLYTQPRFVYDLIHGGDAYAEKVFRKDMQTRKEVLLTKIQKQVGNIIYIDIRRNEKNGLDGYIKGDIGNVSVSTIGAGGYNIQRFHYRTLIKEEKK